MLKGLKKLIFNTDIDDISEEGTVTEIELPKKEKAEALMDPHPGAGCSGGRGAFP